VANDFSGIGFKMMQQVDSSTRADLLQELLLCAMKGARTPHVVTDEGLLMMQKRREQQPDGRTAIEMCASSANQS
jgi:hypothetical protein